MQQAILNCWANRCANDAPISCQTIRDGEHRQRVSEVDHLIEVAADKIVDWINQIFSKNSQKKALGKLKFKRNYTRK
jgi:hypothetical protein